jgi:Tol biopolymer transport system component
MTRLHLALALVPLLLLAACGGGSGGGPPLRFPQSAPDDLVAIVAEVFEDNGFHLVVADVQGRGSAVLTQDVLQGISQIPQDVVWSSDRRLLAFSASVDGFAEEEVFVVDPQRGDPASISGNLGGQASEQVAWQPGGRLLAFRTGGGGLPRRLFIVRSDGSNRIEVSGALPAGASGVDRFAWAPDGSRLAMTLDQQVPGQTELVTVLANGTGRAQVSAPPPVAGGDVRRIVWAPDSSRLLFDGDLLVDNQDELFSALPDGAGGRVRLNGNLPSGGDVFDFAWAPDASRVAFVAPEVGGEGRRLFTCLPDGSGRVAVSIAAVSGGNVGFFEWAPDASRLAYQGDVQVAGLSEAFVVLPTGLAHLQVSGGSVAAGDVGGPGGDPALAWAPSALRLAFTGDLAVDDREELFSVPATGGLRTQHSASVVAGGRFDGRPLWSPLSTQIAYEAEHVTPASEPFVVNAAAGAPVALADTLGDGALLTLFDWSLDGSRLLVGASPVLTGGNEVRGYTPDASGVVLLAGPFVGAITQVVVR